MFPKGKAIAPFQLVVPTGMLKITNLDQSLSCSKKEVSLDRFEKVRSRTKTDFLIPTHFTLGQTPATNGVNAPPSLPTLSNPSCTVRVG